ncbi:MAG: tetratricopeptide repeat protein, partial [Candidatus Atribacteria bacterium]|nr:tetratricopeptide repeat protein [Candidatus Atribacteria bacterium]
MNALIFALNCKIPEELERSKQIPWEITKVRLTKKLIDEYGLVEELSEWAIEAWVEAIKTQSAKINFEKAISFFYRGKENFKKGFYDKAFEDFTLAIQDFIKAIEIDPELAEKINPKLAAAYYNRGDDCFWEEDYDQAIQDYTKAIEIDPKLAEKINPKLAEAYYLRGNAYYNKALYDQAIQDYTKAIEINPKDALFYYNRGIAYQNKKLY